MKLLFNRVFKEEIKSVYKIAFIFFALGFVLGIVVLLFLTKYVKGIDYGNLAEWLGLIGSVGAIFMVIFQVDSSEKLMKEQLIIQSKQEKARMIIDNRPRFYVEAAKFNIDEGIKEKVFSSSDKDEDDQMTKNICQHPKNHTLIKIINLVEPRAINLQVYMEYEEKKDEEIQDINQDGHMIIQDNRSEPEHCSVNMGTLLDNYSYIVPPTAYKLTHSPNANQGDMDGFRYRRIVLKFTSSKLEIGFAEAVNNKLEGKQGLYRDLQYYFVAQDDIPTDVFSSDKMINKQSAKFQQLNNLFNQSNSNIDN